MAKLGSRSDELGSRWYDSGLLISVVFGDSKKVRTLLLVTIGFGGILSNIPGVEIATGDGLLFLVYKIGIETGVFPLIIFMVLER